MNSAGYYLATIGLAPCLIAQGLYVRRVTPRLAEPEGERSGTYGSGPHLKLLILGDSAAAGVGVSTQGQALSGQLVARLGASFEVNWRLMAQTGDKAKQVTAVLQQVAVQEHFDIVVTSIGVNDVTHGTKCKKWISQQGQIVNLLQSKFHVQHIILSGLPPMHLFPALPQPLRWYLGLRARRFNNALKTFAAGCDRCEFVAINFPLEAAYMAADGFHPGALAYSFWAGQLAKIIQSRLAVNVFQKGQGRRNPAILEGIGG